MRGAQLLYSELIGISMVARIAYGYACILLVLEALFFALSLLVHVAVLVGVNKPFANYDIALFRAAVIVGIPIIAFVKDGLRWVEQIKSCPKWLWKTSLALGFYSILIVLFQPIFLQRGHFWEQPLAVSGVPLGFEGISLCILYSVLRCRYLNESELAKAAGRSLLIIGFGIVIFLAYRAGYFRHPRNY